MNPSTENVSLRPANKTASSSTKALNQNESTINTDHIKPKSIIEKFEQLSKFSVPPKPSQNHLQINLNQHVNNILNSNNNSTYGGAASLTYVSSMQSIAPSISPTFDDLEKDEDFEEVEIVEMNDDDENCTIDQYEQQYHHQNHEGEENDEVEYVDDDGMAVYEELQPELANQHDKFNNDGTSLFENDQDNLKTYSISGSSYTGSVMNQEEFNDYEEHDETDLDEIYDVYDEEILSTTQNETIQQQHQSTNIHDDNNVKSQQLKKGYMTDCSNTGSRSVESQATINSGASNLPQPSLSEPLFSIKEYRKQKKTFNSGSSRRSSISAAKNASQNSTSQGRPSQVVKSNKAPIAPLPNSSRVDSIQCEQIKRAKNQERIKELDELIKQEDNIIHQTGIALERCLHDSQFSGSGEHIECNRILLISCQKRQAYMTEINRLKSLLVSSKKSASVDSDNKSDSKQNGSSSSDGEIPPSDLTGLLIFSDIQLPVKESYINKLKLGDGKLKRKQKLFLRIKKNL